MLCLNIGDPNQFGFAPPEHLLSAVEGAMRRNQNGYAPSEGIAEALQAIESDAQARGIRNICHTWVGNGCSEVIDMALTALCDPGENILVPSPGYPLYTALAAKLGIEARPYQLDEANDWQPDVEDMAAHCDAHTRAVVVINPNNPTGSLAAPETLRSVVRLAAERDLVVFADEIYDRLLFDGRQHTPLGSFDPTVSVLTLGGLSKNWIAPGFRIGWGVVSGDAERLQPWLEAVRQLGRARLSANHPEQYGIAPCLQGSQTHITEMMKALTTCRDLAMQRLNAIPGISCVTPRGAFYAFARLHNVESDVRWCSELMQETGVVVVPGSGFGQRPGTQHFRIVLLPSTEIIGEACDAIANFVVRQR
ncbi:MAG: aminotransferase class I/II-fold pyridoxal phosphate-dependent enzyme [Planctomycetes bacterium]|nr:aminotransferase class I/II-fold pyridoxal phosphate-dependent enzyme [Planctomycetota bacterium]